jgi:diguanylate cyclase (GGDEF)-like protein
MSAVADGPAVRTGSGIFTRPASISDGARWLFLWLAVVSVILALPGMLLTARGGLLVLGLLAATVLVVSLSVGFVRRSALFTADLVDALAMMAFALASPKAFSVVMVMFGALWFRSLSGSGARAFLRVTLYAAALGSLFVLWHLVRKDWIGTDFGAFLGLLPTMFFTVLIDRQLGKSLIARDQSMGRDRVLAATGSQLLGARNTAAILELAWTASGEFCAATPGLRLVLLTQDGCTLRVEGTAGEFENVPGRVPGEVLFTRPGTSVARILDPAPLNAVVGTPLMWECVNFEGQGERSWMLVGAPDKVPTDAILSVRGLIGQVVLAIRNAHAHEALSTQARTDSLTGLHNRASLLAELSEGLLVGTEGAGLQLLFLDLDDFKDVNDELGHRAGDVVLIELAARLRDCVRPTDICARLGGDEFAVLLHGAGLAEATRIAQRIVGSVAEPFLVGADPMRVGASIGIATPVAGITIDDLVHQADLAMYAAKAKGKGRVEVFSPDLVGTDRYHTTHA